MLGEQIGEERGRITARRVLPSGGYGPKVEVTFEASGKVLGADATDLGTYWSVVQPNGALYGEGQGVITTPQGDVIQWIGAGRGHFTEQGGVSFRGAVYYQTTGFLALSITALIAVVWGAHRVRLRIIEKHKNEITALNERLMNAQEQERIRIAGELHDGVMQEMLAVTMMLGTAKRRILDNSDAKGTIDKAQQKLIQAGTDIRELSHDLHPPLLQEAGLPKAVHAYCEQFSTACSIPVACDADDSVGELSRGAALALFRIVQEALGNAAKAARLGIWQAVRQVSREGARG